MKLHTVGATEISLRVSAQPWNTKRTINYVRCRKRQPGVANNLTA
jgi:hypothetical protein